MTEALLPVSIEAEQAVLAACVYPLDSRLVTMAASQLRREDFTRPDHQQFFAIIQELVSSDKEVNEVAIIEALKAQDSYDPYEDNSAYLYGLVENSKLVPVPAAVQSYIDILVDRRQRRELMMAGQSILEFAADINNPNPLTHAYQSIDACAACVKSEWRDADAITSTVADSWGTTNHVIPFGLSQLDRIIGGITVGIPELTILGARSSHGKTALARKVALNFAFRGYTVAFYSQETIGEVIIEDMAATMAGVNLYRLKHHGYTNDGAIEAYSRLAEAMGVIKNLGSKLQFKDTAVALPEICMSAKQTVKTHETTDSPVGLIIIDFVQLIDSGIKCRDIRTEMVYIMKKLHDLTRKTSVPVLALSQVTMKSEDRDKHVRRENLAESPGVIVNLADKIIMANSPFVEEERTKPRNVYFYVDKFKRGSTGKAGCLFYPTVQRFADFDEEVIYDE